jgi:tyrosine-protein phosphatase YwqE
VGFFKNFFKSKELAPADLSVLGTDMHSHLIPAIDDGSRDMEMTLDLIKGFEERGFRKLITTPHIQSDHYVNSPSTILPGLEKVRQALADKGSTMQIEAAAEYYIDGSFFELLARKELLPISGKYILVEMSYLAEPPSLKKAFFEILLAGYKPILAHPERYTFWHRELNQYQDLFDREILLQLNINSLAGAYSPEVKRVAEFLIKKGLIRFLGSDCHHPGHLFAMDEARRHPLLHELLESGNLLNSQL